MRLDGRAVCIFLAVVLPVWVWAWVYYGSPLPVTLVAKQQQGLMAISEQFLAGFWELLSQYWEVGYSRAELLLAGLGMLYGTWLLASAILKSGAQTDSNLLAERFRTVLPVILLFAWTAAYFAAYVLLGVARYFWYYAPLAAGLVAAVGLGLQATRRLFIALGGWLVARKQAWTAILGAWMVKTAALVAAGILVWFSVSQWISISRLTPDARLPVYQQVGEWLAGNTPQAARVGMLEVGIIGYYADRTVIDFAGLIQPQTARQLKRETSYEDAALWAVTQYRPEYLVLHAGLFPGLEEQIQSGELTGDSCQEVQRFPRLEFDMVVYACLR